MFALFPAKMQTWQGHAREAHTVLACSLPVLVLWSSPGPCLKPGGRLSPGKLLACLTDLISQALWEIAAAPLPALELPSRAAQVVPTCIIVSRFILEGLIWGIAMVYMLRSAASPIPRGLLRLLLLLL